MFYENSVTYNVYKSCVREIKASLIYKFILSVYLTIAEAWEKSLICHLLFKDVDKCVNSSIKTSQLCVFGGKVSVGFQKVIQGLKVKDSLLVKVLDIVYDLFFRSSLKVFGALGTSFALASLILLLAVGEIHSLRGLLVLAIGFPSLVCLLIPKFIESQLKSSRILALTLRFFNVTLNLPERVESALLFVIAVITGVGLASVFVILPLRFGLVGLVGLPSMILVFQKRYYGLLLIVFLLPIMPTMVILGLIGLVSVAFVLDFLKGEVQFELKSLDVPVALFLVAMLVSVFVAFHMRSSMAVVGTYMAFIALYLVIRATEVKIIHYLLAVSVSGLLVSLYGIYQYITGNISTDNAWVDTEMFVGMVRVYSTLANPNVLGIFLIISIVLSVGLMWVIEPLRLKLLSGLMVIPQVVCMVLTYSRGAWVGLGFAACVVVLFNFRKLFFPALGALTLGFMVMPVRVFERLLSIGNTMDSSTSYRISIWENSIRVIQDFWVTGIGFGTESFNIVYNYYARHSIPTQHSHNLFLHVLMSLGLIGFVLLMMLLIQSCLALIRSSRGGDKKLSSASVFLLAALIGILVQGMTDNIWYNYRIVGIFWVLIAVAHRFYYDYKERLT